MRTVQYKHIYRSIFFALVLLSSCTRENVIDLKPYEKIDAASAFDTPEKIKLAMMGVYYRAQRSGAFAGAYFQYNDMRGEDMVSTASYYTAVYSSSYNANSAEVDNHWTYFYRVVNSANLLIEGVKKAVSNGIIPKENGDSYIGEASFLRAFSHLELLKHFSQPYGKSETDPGVPYHTKPSQSIADVGENAKIGRGTVKEAYNKILEDLDQAEEYLYSKTISSERPGNQKVSRATKEAAIALKVRVYLNMREWDKVIEEANKLDGFYSLCSDPNEPFANNFGNPEGIFSIENTSNNNPGVNGSLPDMYGKRAVIAISPVIWNDKAWIAEDKRRGENMVETKSNQTKYTLKYKDKITRTDASPLIRYAEVLLSRAEAYARKGDDRYLDDLNRVRNRSLKNPKEDAYTGFNTPKERVEAILKERRIEFLAEGMRWGDIHRLNVDDIAKTNGIPAKHKNDYPKNWNEEKGIPGYAIGEQYILQSSDLKEIESSDRRFLWPIPTSETSSNPTMAAQQNPHW